MLLDASPKLQDRKLVRQQQHLTRLQNYRKNHNVLIYSNEYDTKRNYLAAEYSGDKYLQKKPETDPNQPQNPFGDASSNDFMMQAAKGSMAQMIPQSVIMWWVNYFFKGYVIMRLPFDMTANVKSMLQQSISTPDLDAAYVSSVSWYFVNMLGLKSVYGLIFNDDNLVNKLMSQQQQQPIPPMGAGGPTAQKQFIAELEGLKIAPFASCATTAPARLAKKLDL